MLNTCTKLGIEWNIQAVKMGIHRRIGKKYAECSKVKIFALKSAVILKYSLSAILVIILLESIFNLIRWRMSLKEKNKFIMSYRKYH